MAQSLTQVYVHLIFHVKGKYVSIQPNDKEKLYNFISALLRKDDCYPVIINGTHDHVHILCVLSRSKSLSEVVKNIKGITSQWMKDLDKYYTKFFWQRGYGAFSVSPSLYDKTVQYIANQAEHHKKVSTKDEYIIFLKKYNIDYNERYLWEE